MIHTGHIQFCRDFLLWVCVYTHTQTRSIHTSIGVWNDECLCECEQWDKRYSRSLCLCECIHASIVPSIDFVQKDRLRIQCHVIWMCICVYQWASEQQCADKRRERERGMHCDDLQFLLVPIWMDDSLIIIKLNHKNKAKRKHSHKWKRTSIINLYSAVALNAAFISFYRSFVPFHPAYLWHAWIPNEFTTR